MAKKAKKLLGVDPASEKKLADICKTLTAYPKWDDAKVARLHHVPAGLVQDIRAGKRLR